ncbi:MAG: CpaF family protein [Chloroflexi bacterium]|nr:CpaF family protein [Chloroflexota bacterium]
MKAVIEAMTTLLEDDSVVEIMVDGPDQVYIERNGQLEDVDVHFANERQVIDWANGLLVSHGWEPVGEGRLWAEGRLHNKSRILAVIPPVAVSGPSVVIRKSHSGPLTFEQLFSYGSVSPTIVDFIKTVMQARLNVIVAGGTASGKTTLTNMIVELAPAGERLIAVEQVNELRLRNERVIYLEAQAAKASGASAVDVSELLQVAARMRPDRIIVGELMGDEVLQVLRLMNTGLDGMMATIHANSPRDVLARLEKMATMSEPSLTLPVIRAEMAAAIDLIVQIGRLDDGSRKVLSIVEVRDLKGDNVVLEELFAWEKTGVGADGRFTGIFKATGATPSFAPTLATMGLTFPEGTFEP